MANTQDSGKGAGRRPGKRQRRQQQPGSQQTAGDARSDKARPDARPERRGGQAAQSQGSRQMDAQDWEQEKEDTRGAPGVDDVERSLTGRRGDEETGEDEDLPGDDGRGRGRDDRH